jgi:hypothetical protein
MIPVIYKINTKEMQMETNIEAMLAKLGGELVNSPFLSVMIVNRKYQIVWCNQRFAEEFGHAGVLDSNMTCFNAIGSEKVHEGCPLQRSLLAGKCIKGFLDFGDRNFLFLTIPLDEEHAAKVHIFLPKEADNAMEESQ